MIDIINKEMMLNLVTTFLFYFTLGTLGAFTKDLYNTLVNGNAKIELPRIFISAISASFICIGGHNYLSEHISPNVIIFIVFLCGVVGFELFGYISSVDKLKVTLTKFMKFKKAIEKGIIDETLTKTDNKEEDKEDE